MHGCRNCNVNQIKYMIYHADLFFFNRVFCRLVLSLFWRVRYASGAVPLFGPTVLAVPLPAPLRVCFPIFNKLLSTSAPLVFRTMNLRGTPSNRISLCSCDRRNREKEPGNSFALQKSANVGGRILTWELKQIRNVKRSGWWSEPTPTCSILLTGFDSQIHAPE